MQPPKLQKPKGDKVTGIPEQGVSNTGITDPGDPLMSQVNQLDPWSPDRIQGTGTGPEFSNMNSDSMESVPQKYASEPAYIPGQILNPAIPQGEQEVALNSTNNDPRAETKRTIPIIGSAYPLGEGVRRFVSRPNMLSRIMDRGAVPGALALGGLGVLGGWGIGKAYNWFANDEEQLPDWLAPSLLGAAGAVAGGLSGDARYRDKHASWRDGGDSGSILTEALSRSDLPVNSRMQAMAVLPRLTQTETQTLANMLRGAAGAVAGAIIVRFLAGRGLLKAIGGAVAGAALMGIFGGRR